MNCPKCGHGETSHFSRGCFYIPTPGKKCACTLGRGDIYTATLEQANAELIEALKKISAPHEVHCRADSELARSILSKYEVK